MFRCKIEEIKREAEFALNTDDIYYKNEFLRKELPVLLAEIASLNMIIDDLQSSGNHKIIELN